MVENSLLDEFRLACDESPQTALTEVDHFVERARGEDPTVVPELLRAASLTARVVNNAALACEKSQEAIDAAKSLDLPREVLSSALTHSYNLFLVGRTKESLDLVSRLDAEGDQELAARILFQHATILARVGRTEEADERFQLAGGDAAIVGDQRLQARVGKNRGMLAAQGGDHVKAADYFVEALEIFERLEDSYEIAYAKHALGIAATKMGNLPKAFRYFNESEAEVRDIAGDDFESKRSRCEALLIAGLFTEAAQMAEEASKRCLEASLLADAAEIGLVAASAWLDAGQNESASANAVQAQEAFSQQDRVPWAAAARLIALEADYNAGGSLTVEALSGAITTVEKGRLEREASKGKILLARVHLADGNVADCRSVIDMVGTADSPDLVLATKLVSALAFHQSGDPGGVLDEADDGFRVLGRIQSQMGSPLLRSGVSQHARELGELALRSAQSHRGPMELWSWMERIAVSASTPRPITPPSDRKAKTARRQLRLASKGLVKTSELEVAVRDADLAVTENRPDDLAISYSPPRLADTVVLTYGVVDGIIHGCRLVDGAVEAAVTVPMDEVSRSIRALRADQRRWALNPERAKPDRIVAQLAALDRRLVPELDVGDSSIVVVPPPNVFSLPWTALPSLRGHPTSVASSLTSWMQKSQPGSPTSRLLAAGPDLVTANAELDLIRREGDLTLTGKEATVDAVLSGMNGVDAAHLIAHGSTKPENPLFSSLKFADGRLNVYELGALPNPPRVVVLSACNVGAASEDTATTMLGMVTGLLHAGADCVIASPIPVSDSERLAGLLASFHEAWISSSGPAAAWSDLYRFADTTEALADLATFCVYGRG